MSRKSIILAILCSLPFFTTAQIQCNQSQSDPTCNGNPSGIASVAPDGGVGPYEYSWSHQDNLNAPNAFGLSAGAYSVTIADAIGNEQVCNFTITQPDAIIIDEIIEVNPTCGDMNGSLEILATPKNNNPNSTDLEYSIDGGLSFQSNNFFGNLGGSDYLVVVIDGDGCFVLESPQLVNSPPLVVMLMADCSNGGNIDIISSISGGTSGDDEYAWEGPGGATYDTPDLMDVPQGSYSVTVTDRVGCSGEANVSLEDCCNGIDFCNGEVVDSDCEGANTGSISLSPEGGVEPYNYTWSHDATLTGNVASNLGAGMYMVTIEDADGCTDVCDFDVADSSLPMIDNLLIKDPICGESNGSITIIGELEDPNCELQYSIDGGMTFVTVNTFGNLPAGSYDIVVRDCNSCIDSETVILEDSGAPNIFGVMVTCVMDKLLNIEINVTLGTAPYQYQWTGPGTFTSTDQDLIGVENGEYQLLVTDANDCTATLIVDPLENCGSCADIGDFLWEDLNGNGMQDVGELGLAGVNVFLFSDAGTLVSSTTTDATGSYIFEEVDNGDYYIIFDLPAEYSPSKSFNTASDNDSNVDESNGDNSTAIFSISECNNELSIDGGFYQCTTIGKKVWFDKDEDNKCDPDEDGINGVVIDIYRLNEITDDYSLFATVTSGTNPDNGEYGFWNACIPPGTYYLDVSTTINGLAFVLPNVGNDQIDSDITGAFGPGTSDAFTVGSGEEKCDLGIGYLVEATVGDRVWFDENGNGLREPSEAGMPNVMIEVFDQQDVLVKTSYSDINGLYKIDGLGMQEHFIKFTAPDGFGFTFPYAGQDEYSSLVDHSNGLNTTPHFGTICGQHTANINAGLVAGVLPITWLSFYVEELEGQAKLVWEVGDVSATQKFTIERSINGVDFEKIGIVNQINGLHYTYIDEGIQQNQVTYYRINETDAEGKESFSSIQALIIETDEPSKDLRILPNPVENILVVEWDIDHEQLSNTELQIVNEEGKIIMDNIRFESLSTTVTLNLGDLPNGIYFLKAASGNQIRVKRIVKI